jgi:hypothetical protein
VYIENPDPAIGTNPFGDYWTTVDPRKVANFADAAGLPANVSWMIENGQAKIFIGEIINNEGIWASSAKAITGESFANRGGLFELQIENAYSKVRQVAPPVPLKQHWGF